MPTQRPSPPPDGADSDEREITAAEMARRHELETLRPPSVTANAGSVQPFVRIVVTPSAIAVDDIAMRYAMRSWHRAHLRARPNVEHTPVLEPHAVALQRWALAPTDLRGGAAGLYIEPLGRVLRRVRAFDDANVATNHTWPARGVNVLVAGDDAPAGLVYRVIATARDEGFSEPQLVEWWQQRFLALSLDAPGALDPSAPAPLAVVLAANRVRVRLDGAELSRDCTRAGPPVLDLPVPRDAAAGHDLARCLQAVRPRYPPQEQRIAIRFTADAPYAAVLATAASVIETDANLRDLFTMPILQLVDEHANARPAARPTR